MALLSPQQINKAGLQATYTAVNLTDTVNPDNNLILHVKNGAGSSITVTLTDTSLTSAGSAAANPTVTVVNATDKFIYLPAALAAVSGIITITYSSATTITAALLRM